LDPIQVVKNELNLNEMFDYFVDEGKVDQGALNRILQESVSDALKTAFGEKLVDVVEEILDIFDPDLSGVIDTHGFEEKLESLFGSDARSIEMMIKGQLLTRYYQLEFNRKMAVTLA
jgi:hypothetical protein